MAGAENLRDRNDFQDAITWLGIVGDWEHRNVHVDPDLISDVGERMLRRRDQLYALASLTFDQVEIPAVSIVGPALGEGQYSAESSS